MSDKFTMVIPGTSTASHACRGHIPRADAITEAIRHAKAEIGRYQDMLADIHAGRVRVYWQTGLYKVKDRKELLP